PMLKEVDQLIFPKYEAWFSQIGVSRVINWGLTGAFQNVEKMKSDSEKVIKDSSDKLAHTEGGIARLRASLDSSKKKLYRTDEMDATEKIDKASYEAIIQIKGEIMHQYIHGDIDSWKLEKVQNDLNLSMQDCSSRSSYTTENFPIVAWCLQCPKAICI
ncbi:hypothetical protein Ddye_016065, partial [Dipteronia dyeriana]